MKRLVSKWKKFKRFMVSDVWDIEPSSLSRLRALGVRTTRVIHLVFKGFKDDECPLHASALTFNTLLAIVPILALSLSLARVFGGDEKAEMRLREAVGKVTHMLTSDQYNGEQGANAGRGEKDMDQPSPQGQGIDQELIKNQPEGTLTPDELAARLNGSVDDVLEWVRGVNFVELGSVGFILLIWMVIVVLGRVEASFNRVWGVSDGRPMLRKFTDYMFMVIVLPFLVTLAFSIPVAEILYRAVPQNQTAALQKFLQSGFLKNSMVFVLTVATFTVLIRFMPNAKVLFLPAVVGGAVTAILFIFWLWLCTSFQIAVARYSALYGSFALVPIVLAWVYVSWEIILFGAEVAFAVQNCGTYKMEQGARRANMQSKIMLALSIVVETARSMLTKERGFLVADYARNEKIPVRFVNEVVDELVKAEFLAELSDGRRYVLLKAPSSLHVQEIVDGILKTGVGPEDLGLNGINPKISQIARTASEGIGGSMRKTTIASLVAE